MDAPFGHYGGQALTMFGRIFFRALDFPGANWITYLLEILEKFDESSRNSFLLKVGLERVVTYDRQSFHRCR